MITDVIIIDYISDGVTTDLSAVLFLNSGICASSKKVTTSGMLSKELEDRVVHTASEIVCGSVYRGIILRITLQPFKAGYCFCSVYQAVRI